MLKKLIVFANDPLKEYYLKGELVDRYFNPGDFFDEVHFISLAEKEIEEDKIQHTAGRARVKIHTVGRIGPWIFFPFSEGRKRITRLVKEIQPNCLRAYNAHIQGFLGASLSRKLSIPLVVSLHINPERDIRAFLNPFREPLKWIFWNFNKYINEPFVLNRADKIICVYNFIYNFAKGLCKNRNKIELIYNRIDMDQFNPVIKPNRSDSKVKILCVGRLFQRKNPEHLIKAMPKLDAELTIIGNGPYQKRMHELIRSLDLSGRVFIISSVANKEIHKYYQDADIFVSVTDYGETSKVMIEAMASGLPIVINRTRWGQPELLEDTAVVVENSSIGFEKALKNLIANPAERKTLGIRNREKALTINSRIMEEKEMMVYKSVVNKR